MGENRGNSHRVDDHFATFLFADQFICFYRLFHGLLLVKTGSRSREAAAALCHLIILAIVKRSKRQMTIILLLIAQNRLSDANEATTLINASCYVCPRDVNN